MSDIVAEFGGSAPHKLSEYVTQGHPNRMSGYYGLSNEPTWTTVAYTDQNYSGAGNLHEPIITNRTELVALKVNVRVASSRSTGSSGYFQNRKVTVTVWYRESGTATWISGVSQTVNINRMSNHSLALNLAMPSRADYDLKVTYTAADRSGTFTTTPQYEYKTVFSNPADLSTNKDASIVVNTPGLSSWSLTSASVAFNWRFYSRLPYGASAQLYLPADASGGTEKINLGTSDYDEWGDDGREKSGSRSFAINASNTLPFDLSAYDATYIISNITGTFNYRRLKPVSASPGNNFYLDSIEYGQFI